MCDFQIHEQLKDMLEYSCPFCDQVLVEIDKVTDTCCDKQCIENLNGIRTCIHCGLTYGCVYDTGYHDFYDNMHKIHRKSVYQRKYHIENVLNGLCLGNFIDLSLNQRDRIYKVFNEIKTVLPLVNKTRKRMISVNFIIKKIFEIMGLPYNKIPITKSRKTSAFYDQYWSKIMSLIGDKIIDIIQ